MKSPISGIAGMYNCGWTSLWLLGIHSEVPVSARKVLYRLKLSASARVFFFIKIKSMLASLLFYGVISMYGSRAKLGRSWPGPSLALSGGSLRARENVLI